MEQKKIPVPFFVKIYFIVDYYNDYFEMTGNSFRESNGEHHSALNHTLKSWKELQNYTRGVTKLCMFKQFLY